MIGEHCNNPSGSIKCWEFLEWVSNSWPLKKVSAPWNYRAIGLVLDFIHRLVCGRRKIPQRFGDSEITGLRLVLSNGPN
jgi:hypothetical protein